MSKQVQRWRQLASKPYQSDRLRLGLRSVSTPCEASVFSSNYRLAAPTSLYPSEAKLAFMSLL